MPAAPAPAAIDWAAALRSCAASRVVIVRDDALLVHVTPPAVAHPLLALLPRSSGGFFLVLRLHARVAALQQHVHDCELQQALLESLVFEERAVDAANAQRARGQLALATPLFCSRAVAAGVLRSFAVDEAHANAALADVTRALQTCEEEPAFLDADDALVVVVEHDGGYVGQTFAGRVVASTIRVEVTPFAADGDGAATALDSVLEAYEDDFRDQMELHGVEEQPQRLAVSVRAGFAVATRQSPESSPLGALLLSSWGGIENIRALRCNPPPNSSSLLCIGGLASCWAAGAHRRSEAAAAVKSRATAFPTRLQETVAFLAKLRNSVDDDEFKWSANDSQTQDDAAAMEDSDHGHLLRKFRRFLSSPDAPQDNTIDLNNTLELNIALDFASTADDLPKSRSDLDFLEKMWDFVLCSARSADAAVTLVHECVATFATVRTIPFVHPSNSTRLGEFLKTRAATANEDNVEMLHSMQTQLSNRQEALSALVELGEWKMRRDVTAWFVQIGFTAAESSRIIEQFEQQEADPTPSSRSHTHVAMQQLVDVCATAHSLGTSGSLLRKLANDCLGYSTRLGRRAAENGAPSFVLPLSSFIPERTRANLGDALFWDVEMSFGELMERTVRICETTFHRKCLAFSSQENENELPPPALAPRVLEQLRRRLPQEVLLLPDVSAFMEQAERADEDQLPTPTELVKFTCTVRNLTH